MSEQEIIAVDFDGTLFTNAYPEIGEPIDTIIEYVKRAKASGAFIILWTCRCDGYLAAAVAACEAQGLTFDAVNENAPHNIAKYGNNSRKVNADLYIDDKAIHTEALCGHLLYHFGTIEIKDIEHLPVTEMVLVEKNAAEGGGL